MKTVGVFRTGETGTRLIDVPSPRLDEVAAGRDVIKVVCDVGTAA